MIFVGKRMCGKTYHAMMEISKRAKAGDVIGVVSFKREYANLLKKSLKAIINSKDIEVKVIDFEDAYMANHVLVDELDKVLGDKFVCSTGGVIKLNKRDDVKDDKSVYQEVENIVCSESEKLIKIVQKSKKDMEDAIKDYSLAVSRLREFNGNLSFPNIKLVDDNKGAGIILNGGTVFVSTTPTKFPKILKIVHNKIKRFEREEFTASFVIEDSEELSARIEEIANTKELPQLLDLKFSEYENKAEVIIITVTDCEIRDVDVKFMTNHEYNNKDITK